MLRGIDPLLTSDLLAILAAMGHGDDLVLVDRNFPADSVARETVTGQLIVDRGVDTTRMAKAILSVFPLDSFVENPISRMEVVGKPEEVLPVHRDLLAAAEAAEGQPVGMASIERHAFYATAKKAYAVVATGENRPYGCFILKKGVIFD
jgi:L-fucose mutarotase